MGIIVKNKLWKIILRRIFSSVVLLFFVITFVFFLIHLSPGNPAQKFLSPDFDTKLFNQIYTSYNLGGNIFAQYFAYLGNVLTGNFGISYIYREPVTEVISKYLPFTLVFGAVSFVLQIAISFLLVFFTFRCQSKRFEKLISNINLTLYSIPVFISSILLIYIFSFKLNIFPPSGLTSFNSYNEDFFRRFADYIYHLTLPFIAAGFVAVPVYYKYLYVEIKKIANQNFIKELEILGMKKNVILFKHIIPNALNSLIAVAGVELGVLLSGSVLIETIFALPGMGFLTMHAIANRDYPLIIAVVLVSAVIILTVNLFADILRSIIDKRLLENLML